MESMRMIRLMRSLVMTVNLLLCAALCCYVGVVAATTTVVVTILLAVQYIFIYI